MLILQDLPCVVRLQSISRDPVMSDKNFANAFDEFNKESNHRIGIRSNFAPRGQWKPAQGQARTRAPPWVRLRIKLGYPETVREPFDYQKRLANQECGARSFRNELL